MFLIIKSAMKDSLNRNNAILLTNYAAANAGQYQQITTNGSTILSSTKTSQITPIISNNLIISTESTSTLSSTPTIATTPLMKTVKKEKTKRKNSEKRKEKSRKAARERRSQEAKIFDEIEKILPVSEKVLDHLDKASLVRIAINYLKIRSVVDSIEVPKTVDSFDLADNSFLNTLNSFMFVLSKDGDIIYLSDNVERFLGLSQIDLMGQSIYDYSHPCDHDEIKSFLEPLTNAFNASKLESDQFSTKNKINNDNVNKKIFIENNVNSSTNGNSSKDNNDDINNNDDDDNVKYKKQKQQSPRQCSFDQRRPKIIDAIGEATGPYFIRMKCTLNNKGRNLNLKSANYKVIKCRGRMIDLEVANPKQAKLIGENYRHYMIAMAELIQNPIRIEIPMKSDVFISKHSPDMKFVYVDDSIKDLFGYNVNDLIGTSFYQYFDANDFTQLNILFKTLFAKGQCDFGQYKFLAKTGGFRWISTQATIINEPNSSKPQSIILIHRVISNIEDGHLLTSNVQSKSIETSNLPSTTLTDTASLLNNAAISATSSVIISKPIDTAVTNNCQLPGLLNVSTVPNNPNTSDNIKTQFKIKEEQEQEELSIQQQRPAEPLPPQQSSLCPQLHSVTEQFISSTETVLAPKTADMESGFLVFTEDNKGLAVLSDADDLTHLAPDAGDLCVPMLPDLNFADMNIFDELLLNSSSYNIATSGVFSEDEFLNNLAMDNEKLKVDNIDMEYESKRFHSENLLDINNKEFKMNPFEYPLDVNSNDPFLSFTNTNNNDEFLITNSPTTQSDCSMNETFSCNSSINSYSSNSIQYSPKSISCDETNKYCDNDESDLEMRAPYIPIDDDYLLNDFTYSNIDDLFDWISNDNNLTNSNNNNNKTNLNGNEPYQQQRNGGKINEKTNKLSTIPKLTGGCLEALLQNDELICNLKNKMYSSNQILNREQLLESIPSTIVQQPPAAASTLAKSTVAVKSINENSNLNSNNNDNNNSNSNNNVGLSTIIADNTNNNNSNTNNGNHISMKRKNSNIFFYTTMSNTGEKKIKNLILTPEISANKLNGSNPSPSIHHFVLIKNNELMPKVSFTEQTAQQQQQTFKVPKRMLTNQQHELKNVPGQIAAGPPTLINVNQLNESIKENVFKKPRSDSMKNFSSNSVLLNLLVNGSDLSNGYELTHATSQANTQQQMKSANIACIL